MRKCAKNTKKDNQKKCEFYHQNYNYSMSEIKATAKRACAKAID